MLVSFLSTFLGFGADLLRIEVLASFRWINRLCLISVHNIFSYIYKFEQV
jgi:hypothetical protein